MVIVISSVYNFYLYISILRNIKEGLNFYLHLLGNTLVYFTLKSVLYSGAL